MGLFSAPKTETWGELWAGGWVGYRGGRAGYVWVWSTLVPEVGEASMHQAELNV